MTEFEKAHDVISELAKAFRAHESKYLSPNYQEVEVRKDFIDKFWKALGWDVDHDIQKNPYEQEVKVERGQQQGAARKRADYAFSVAPNFRDVRFFVEAKKPSGELENGDDYFQTTRYGWNSQNPLAVLTDFEQFHILDCRYKPNIETALSRAVPDAKFHYTEYLDAEKFARIYWLFSREAVAAGSIEKFAAGMPQPRGRAVQRGLFPGGYQSIDESFLDELDEIRADLARAFKKTNADLGGEDLTEIVQRTIDRLVFIRFLEDRLIESQYLVATFGDKSTAWEDFIAASRKLDGVYNGIVFKRHAKLDDRHFAPDDALFSAICEDLSHINSPYDFNAIPIHILGSIYERFLGKVIVATDKRARVEEKPEVRKAGGVYYTPEYIVRYIVENTVGKLIEGKSPAQIAEMRFGDIACGSGSFLLGVYDLLIRYHTKFYNDNPSKAKRGDVMERDDGLHVTLQKKRAILLNNIFGVDIDMQAVEVAQLSLYLKLLQDETPGSARAHQLEFHETLLPPLNNNITCGNSLIGTDILSGELFEPVEERKLNPMDFEQRFPEIMKRGGFDAVVGNPPYGAYLDEVGKSYLNRKYSRQSYQLDSYLLFLERAVDCLLKENGLFGMIIPNPWLTNLLQDKIRKFVTNESSIAEIVHFRFAVFPKVTVDTEIVILQKRKPRNHRAKISIVETLDRFQGLSKDAGITQIIHEQKKWQMLEGGVINIFLNLEDEALAAKCNKRGRPLNTFCKINVGIKPYQVGKGEPKQTREIVDERPFDNSQRVSKAYRPCLRGSDIARYLISPIEPRFLKYGPWLAEPRPAANFDAAVKLFMRQTGDSLVATLDSEQFLCLNNMHVLVPTVAQPSPAYLLAVINSRLLNWYYHTLNPELGEALAEVKRTNVARLPICSIDASKLADKTRHDKIVSLVEHMLSAKKQLAAVQSDKDKDFYENKCAGLDRQIDALVYELYGLTDEEIALVEDA